MKHWFIIWFLWLFFATAQSQKEEPIEVIHADRMLVLEQYPGQKLLQGHVRLRHKDAVLTCDQAILDTEKNFAEAVGNVELNQGDTLRLHSEILRYDGQNDFALALKNVRLTDPQMFLETDTLAYDRQKEVAYYRSGGFIRDSINTIRSETGKYFPKQKRYEFIENVVINNPDYVIQSTHLDYNTENQISHFYGPTKIVSPSGDYIYARSGYYDSRSNSGWFKDNAFVRSKDSWLSADSIYADKTKGFYSASGNVKMQDIQNKLIALSGYAEQWETRDSTVLSENPLVMSYDTRDTLYTAAGKILIKKRDSARVVWAFPDVRFLQQNFSGRCDSLYRDPFKHTIELYRSPVLWNEDTQITGQQITIKLDSLNNRADSLFIPKDVFIAQKDSAGFNQIKGEKLSGKFIDNKLRKIRIVGNAETIYYLRDDNGKLVGIDKSACSEINIETDENGQAEKIYLREEPSGTTYPPEKFPDKLKTLPGFKWLGHLRIKSKEELLEGRNTKVKVPEEKTEKSGAPVKKLLPQRLFKRL